MKKLLLLTATFILVSCQDQLPVTKVGTLKVNNIFTIKTNEGNTSFKQEEYSVGLTISPLESEDLLIKVAFNQDALSYPLSKETLSKTKVFSLNLKSLEDQDFTVKGNVVEKLLNTKIVNVFESCIKCDFCQIVKTKYVGNSAVTTTSYEHSCACPGQKEVKKEVKKMSRSLNLDFISLDGKSLATFKQVPQIYNNTTDLGVEGDCL